MPDIRGHLLPTYVMADESYSMKTHLDELNAGLASLHEALLGEPMAAAKVRFAILGFSNDVAVRLELTDLRRTVELPPLHTRADTSYRGAFADLLRRIPRDIRALKAEGYAVHRPAVFFLSDGQPNRRENWLETHQRLTDRYQLREAPNIIACGIGDARAATILRVSTQPEFAFVAVPGHDLGQAISRFCTALTRSIVESSRTVGGVGAELVVERPEGFRMAIDVI